MRMDEDSDTHNVRYIRDQVTARDRRCLFGEKRTATKNSSVASSTMAGPDGISQMEERSTPPTEQETPMRIEYQVRVERL